MVNWTGYELILGSSIDPQFGPVLLFGMGGQLVEVFKDRALGLPPLTTTLARRMMESTKIYTALKGVRGRRGVDLDRARAAPRPLQPARRRAALDQRDRHQPAARLAGAPHRARRARRAPRPGDRPEGPAAPGDPPVSAQVRQHAGPAPTATSLTIRPIRPEDEPLMVEFHRVALRRRRSSSATSSTSASTSGPPTSASIRICFVDYDREMALVAECDHPDPGLPRIVGRRAALARRSGPTTPSSPCSSPTPARARASGRSCCAASWRSPAPRAWPRWAPTCGPTTPGMRRAAEKVGFAIRPGRRGRCAASGDAAGLIRHDPLSRRRAAPRPAPAGPATGRDPARRRSS